MWFRIATTLLVATSCVYGQLTRDEVNQFTLAGGCRVLDGKIGSNLSASLRNGVVYIESNHVPNHEWQTVNPNAPKAIYEKYEFKTPTPLRSGQELCTNQGPIAIAKNGVFIFDPTAGGGGNAKALETMDKGGGHTAPFGEYHYHYLPDNKIVWDSNNPRSQFIGVAFDGYPIYSEGRGVDTSKLDVCRGMIINGRYTYIATDKHYPYFLGCFHGQPQVSRAVGSSSCSRMTVGQACTCSYGVLSDTASSRNKRQLIDLLREIAGENKVEKKQYSGYSNNQGGYNSQGGYNNQGGYNTQGGYPNQNQGGYNNQGGFGQGGFNQGGFGQGGNGQNGNGQGGYGQGGYGQGGGTSNNLQTYCGANEIGTGGPQGGPGPMGGGPGRGPPGMGGPGRGPPPGSGQQGQSNGGQNGGFGNQNGGFSNQNGGFSNQNGGFGGQSFSYPNQNGGGVSTSNSGSDGQFDLSQIPPWLIYQMWREYSNQRNNQYNGNQFSGMGGGRGRGRGSSSGSGSYSGKRSLLLSKLTEDMQLERRQSNNQFLDTIMGLLGNVNLDTIGSIIPGLGGNQGGNQGSNQPASQGGNQGYPVGNQGNNNQGDKQKGGSDFFSDILGVFSG